MAIEAATLERLLREPSPDAWRLVIERAIAIASPPLGRAQRQMNRIKCGGAAAF